MRGGLGQDGTGSVLRHMLRHALAKRHLLDYGVDMVVRIWRGVAECAMRMMRL